MNQDERTKFERDKQARVLLHGRVDNDFGFHKATDVTGPMHQEIRGKFIQLAHWLIEHTPPSREQALALTALQEAAMWSNAAVAINLAPLVEE